MLEPEEEDEVEVREAKKEADQREIDMVLR